MLSNSQTCLFKNAMNCLGNVCTMHWNIKTWNDDHLHEKGFIYLSGERSARWTSGPLFAPEFKDIKKF